MFLDIKREFFGVLTVCLVLEDFTIDRNEKQSGI